MNKKEILLLVLAILGATDLAWKGASLLFPRFLSLQSRIWRMVADMFAVTAFRRKAVAIRVEEVLNQSVFNLQKYLPSGWIKRAKIQWVRNPKAAQLRDGDIVLRVRPQKQIDHNLMHALSIYFHNALFPDSRDLVPGELVSATALAITRSALEDEHQYLLNEFDKVFLKTAGEGKEAILNHFADCVRLNRYGLLMGPFVREVDYAANSARFTFDRAELPKTIEAIKDHMLSFQPLVRVKLPEEGWWHLGGGSSYGFILVSKPPDKRPGIQVYVRRAQEKVSKGVKRLYIIGRNEERDFVSSVISAILNIRELKGVELFSLFRDYRGDPGGVGALLGLDTLLAKLNLSPRQVDSVEPQYSETSLSVEASVSSNGKESHSSTESAFSKIAEGIMIRLSGDQGEWIDLGNFGSALRAEIPEFTPKDHGGRNLADVVRKLGCLEIDERQDPRGTSIWVRLKRKNQNGTLNRATDEPNPLARRIVNIVRTNADQNGWVYFPIIERLLKIEIPNFDPAKDLGSSLRDFMRGIPSLEADNNGNGNTHVSFRIKR